MSETNSNPAPASQSQPTVKHLCIKSQDGNESYYKVKCDIPIKRLLRAYCRSNNIDYDAIAFLYDGKRINDTETPDELGMEDEDEIEALYHQTGGAVSHEEY